MRDNPDGGIDRREALLDGAIAVTAACAGTLVAWPAVRSLTPPSGSGVRRGVVGRREDFAPGTAAPCPSTLPLLPRPRNPPVRRGSGLASSAAPG